MSDSIRIVGSAVLADDELCHDNIKEDAFYSPIYRCFIDLIEDIYLFELNGSVDIKERLDKHFREGGTELNTTSRCLEKPTGKVH